MDSIVPQSDQKHQLRSDYYVYYLNRPPKPDTPSHLINPDGTVTFYIGKGKGARFQQHEWCAKREQKCRHLTCRVIRKEWRNGGQIAKEKAYEGLTESESHELEKALIAYGRSIGLPLINLTDGGEGISGYKGDTHPPSQRENHRQSMKRNYSDPEKLERFRQVHIEWWENNHQAREAVRKRFEDPAVRAKAGEANIGNAYHAKTYEGFQSPMGQVYTNVHHLKKFSEEHGLLSAKMCQVANGERLSHKGWTRYPPLEREQKPTYAKAGFKDPNGVIYEAESIPSLTDFCREHDLARTCMTQLGTGTLHSHKGWTRYPEIKAERDYHGTYTGPSLLSPEGTVYTTEEIDNLTAFCHKHNLQTSNMSLVAQGKQRAHKGWTRFRPEDPAQSTLF